MIWLFFLNHVPQAQNFKLWASPEVVVWAGLSNSQSIGYSYTTISTRLKITTLKDSRNNQYLIVESNTMLLRTVSSAEFEHFKQNEITWFTACNGFAPIYEDSSNLFEICIAGIDDKRLFFDKVLGIFMFLNPYYQTSHLLIMNMRLVQNVRTNSFEFASLSCARGHLQLENGFIRIGTETLLSIEE